MCSCSDFGTCVWSPSTPCLLIFWASSCRECIKGSHKVCVVHLYPYKFGGEACKKLLFSDLLPEPLLVLIFVVGLVEVTVQLKEVSRFIYLYRHNALELSFI